jgi:DNA-binding LacI/PurR family transcriptional regulator
VGEPDGNLDARRGRRTGSDHQYVTLQDVAARAGVSAKSVSRVVNRQGELSESTRKRIQGVIDELGYRPNIVARSLLRKRTNTLAAVAWGIEYFGPSRTITGIEHQAEELGYSVFLILVREPQSPEYQNILDALLSRRVDGIVWAVPEVGQNRGWLRAEWLRQLPPITFLTMHAMPGVRVVAVNNRGGARAATDHLIQRGRTRIGIITGPMAWWEARERYEGWKAAIESSGRAAPKCLAAESPWSSAGGERAMRELLEGSPDIDGVFASSDQIALGALRAIEAAGKRVPEDIAIVGFDNMPESEYFRPALTTVHQGLADAGRAAVRAVHQTIEAGAEPRRASAELVTLIEPELVIRSSAI